MYGALMINKFHFYEYMKTKQEIIYVQRKKEEKNISTNCKMEILKLASLF